MVRTAFALILLSLIFITRNPSQTAEILSFNTISEPSPNDVLSDREQSILNSYPCPKECNCRIIVNPERIVVLCNRNVLSNDKYLSELNKTSVLSYMVIDCNPDNHETSTLSDGIFESLHAFVSVWFKNCYIAYVSERAFSGMRSLLQIVIQGGRIWRFDEKSLQLPELSKLEAVSFTETTLSVAPSLCSLENLWYVNFSRNGLKSFKDTGMICTIPGNIEIMDISDNSIEDLPAKFISVTSKLKCLVCAGNKIRKIDTTLLENLPEIEILSIEENKLTELPLDFLRINSKMLTLNLAYNKIKALPVSVFSNLRKIVILNLYGMGLNNDVWPELKYLTTLQVLYMTNNNLSSFDNATLSQLNALKQFDISGNVFQELTNGTFAFQGNLTFLNMSSNRIERVEKASFDGLFFLNTLYLQNNQIKAFHSDALSQLLSLQILNISYNHLEVIPRLPRFLRILDLRYNDIIYFETNTFREIYMLMGISLMSNKLTVLPENAFKTNDDLLILNLAYNNISSVNNQVFPSISKLEAIVLYNNNISAIDTFTNKQFPNLKILHLSNNKLVTLASGKSARLFPDSIEELILSGNQIHFIQNDALKLKNIRDLDLRMNRISTLSREILEVARPNFMPVNYYLSGNPFLCDCNLAWLKEVTHTQARVYDDLYIIRDLRSLNCETVYRHEPGLMKDLQTSCFLCTYTMHCLDVCECCGNAECVCRSKCPRHCTCYQNYKEQVDIVDCLGTQLQSVPKDISANCSILDLSGNNLTTFAADTFMTLSHLKELYLNKSQICEIKGETFSGLYNLSILNPGSNFLHYLAPAMFKDLHRLKYLIISFNKISRVGENSFDSLTNLQYLDLSGNELKTISSHEFTSMSKITSLKLSGNPWSCECQFLETMNNFTLTHAKRIVDLHDIVCEKLTNTSTNGTEIHPLSDLRLPDFCVNSKSFSSILGKSAVAALGTVLAIFIAGLVLFVFIFWNRNFLQVWCFVKFGWKFNKAEKQDGVSRPYDAFVSYSGHDEKFIVRELVPYLEEPKHNRKGFKLCLHHRDFPVGAPIAETIISYVKRSKRIIIVLSDNFLKSEWCQYEFKTAHQQLLQERKNRIIMILLHEINADLLDEELKLYLKTCTYVQSEDRWLWPKIEYAMPKLNPKHAKDLGTNLPETEFMSKNQKVRMSELEDQCGDKIELIA